jgi:CheY-like chemotaxis protein
MTRVLLIDDSPSVLRLLKFLFESEKYDVVTASDATEGLARINERLPDIIITDGVMPGLDGSALLEKLKAQPATKNIPVIVLTSAESDPGEVPASGATAVIQKSADFTPLLNKVAEALKAR